MSIRLSTAFLGGLLVTFGAGTAGAQPFSGCGTIFQGVECVLFEADGGGVYLLDDFGGFEVGDEVFVEGEIDPGCITICLQGDGCIYVDTIDLCTPPPSDEFIRGDVNGDGDLNGLVDGIYLLNFGFVGGPPPPCDDAADVDDNGVVDPLVDTLRLLNFTFVSPTPPPPPPFPDCGPDPTGDAVECAAPPSICL